ncbi:beta-ketoacyl-ACP synthase III [Sessilibacter corallicola]|uniref:3-oxoacyl-ACP synthase n=1 Tax=Sessilibacter corallicola TaxID=2904075 RepID=A0ABQ0ABE6_9GAMM
MQAYINYTGSFLPGEPVDNNDIENHLGLVNGKPSRLKHKILKANGIKTRHYAIDNQQKTLYLNQQLAAKAAENCLDRAAINPEKIKLLSVATSQGDLVLPGFGSQVQAQLGMQDVELFSSHGICSCSMMALKNAANLIRLGEHKRALVVASEMPSRLFKASRYEACANAVDFNAEFLRWMLSDGAGALLLEDTPKPGGVKIEWQRSFSHADTLPVCMSVGMPKGSTNPEAGATWQDFSTYAEAEEAGALLLRQDVRLLDNIVKLGVEGFLRLLEEQLVAIDEIDHVLCHYSSDHFRGKIFELLKDSGSMVPEEKWYTNLYARGNTGCASIFIMLDEFLKTQHYQSGDKIFCMVPESGRFNTAYMLLTVN